MTRNLHVGCISWTYPDWLGSFYPQGTRSSDFLSLYSKVFDLVEIDSTFYRLPTATTVKHWREKTPDDFLFTVKLSKRITHDARFKEVRENLKSFESIIKNLENKLVCVMAQLPPNFKFEKGFVSLSNFLDEIDPKLRYAIEFRDASWYRDETYDLLKQKKVSMVWSVLQGKENIMMIQPVVTTDFIYLRFMGQFGQYGKFDHIQEEKPAVLKTWADRLRAVPESVTECYVLMSNHFEGFAPSTVNSFRKLMGLESLNWEERMRAADSSTLAF